ncbi:phosphonate C-P lyase system protein PhnH [Paradevosia shaoguanensis]|uniref:Phosphonate C-P lyase system protein PhnH n=1 Tax=Paradevosia shaoguanensis TaxID=1335043 RepID=A0AA41UC36_9HYPH|nr:phosphonate C-P lyase system protein PhnH [Paradevosia shaoguanensis]MCF1743462.1 phosphonate C-P lyase system protein PhnH [Paradevosia shaoguanensis]MCI0127945.1 phosphonate C-P lyase system protein PhnH [Paradevosia shaoguanensis]
MDNLVLDGGFVDLVKDSQSVFRTVMDALSRPGLKQPIHVDAAPPAPLSPEVAAIALTLADHDSPVWLDETLAASEAVVAWLKFHTGAPIVSDPREADFALVTGWATLPRLDAFGIGSDEYPDRSTTVVLAVEGFDGADRTITGPGIKDTGTLTIAGITGDFIAQWALNRELFPCGVDVVFAGAGQVVGLPRTTRIVEA